MNRIKRKTGAEKPPRSCDYIAFPYGDGFGDCCTVGRHAYMPPSNSPTLTIICGAMWASLPTSDRGSLLGAKTIHPDYSRRGQRRTGLSTVGRHAYMPPSNSPTLTIICGAMWASLPTSDRESHRGRYSKLIWLSCSATFWRQQRWHMAT